MYVGSFAVGKTSLAQQFVNSIFSEKYHATIGVKIDKKGEKPFIALIDKSDLVDEWNIDDSIIGELTAGAASFQDKR